MQFMTWLNPPAFEHGSFRRGRVADKYSRSPNTAQLSKSSMAKLVLARLSIWSLHSGRFRTYSTSYKDHVTMASWLLPYTCLVPGR